MNERPEEWLERLFEFEFCAECGGDAEDHEICIVPGIGNYFARCKHSPFADTAGDGLTPADEGRAMGRLCIRPRSASIDSHKMQKLDEDKSHAK